MRHQIFIPKSLTEEQLEKKLLEKAREPRDLIGTFSGSVVKVEQKEEWIVEGRIHSEFIGTPQKRTATISKNYLEIELKDAPLKTMKFYGNSPVRGGDEITAYVFTGKNKECPSGKSIFVDNDFSKEMMGICISILDSKGNTIRKDYADNYDQRSGYIHFYTKKED